MPGKTRKRGRPENNNNNNNNGLVNSSRKRLRPDLKKVLVLCQRKTGGDKDAEYVEKNVKRINDYVKHYFNPYKIQIEYLSGLDGREGTVDYHFDFSDNEETEKFVEKHKNKYSMIILYTCPFVIFVNSEFILRNLNSLLINNGVLVFKNYVQDSLNNILEPKDPNRNNHFKFYKREPFTNYFIASETDHEGSIIFTSYNKNNNRNRSLKRAANRNEFLMHLDRLSNIFKHRKPR